MRESITTKLGLEVLQGKGVVNKIFTVLAHAFNKLSSPLFNLVISFLVIRFFSDTLWGEFIFISLIANLTLQLVAWGHKEYLIKSFSQHPSQVAVLWQRSFTARSAIYALCVPFLIFLFNLPFEAKVAIAVWIFVLHIHRSFDVLVLYYRDFNFSTSLEISGYSILIIGIFLFRTDFATLHLVWLHVIITALKSVCLILFYRKQIFQRFDLKIDISFYRKAFPFFLPALIGFLHSKADIYIVALVLSKAQLAEYQVFISLLSMVHQVALLAIDPYSKNIYRLNDAVINKFAWRFFKYGVIASLFAIPVVYLVVEFYYPFTLPLIAYPLGYVLILPLFFYSIKTYQWFKHDHAYKVVMVNLAMASVSLLASLVWIPLWGLTGGLAASCVSQWLAFLIFLKNPKHKTVS